MRQMKFAGLNIFHEVQLGAGVLENIAGMINHYAALAGRTNLPPVTLSGPEFGEPWEKIVTLTICGNAGGSDEEYRAGVKKYDCLLLYAASPCDPPPGHSSPYPQTLEPVIAHEITHLRWKTLRHGIEFEARVLALLRGAQFPTASSQWSQVTNKIMTETRKESREWIAGFLKESGFPPSTRRSLV